MINFDKTIATTIVVSAMLLGSSVKALETNGADFKYVTGDITGLKTGFLNSQDLTINVTGFKVSLGSKTVLGGEDDDENAPLLTGHIEKLNDDDSNESITKADIGLLVKVGDITYITGAIGLLSSTIGDSTISTGDDILGGSFLKIGGGYTFNIFDSLEVSTGYSRYLTFGEGMNELDLGIKYKFYADAAISVDYTSSTGAASVVSGNRVASGLAIQF
jgi:hypothetical protein